MFHTVQSILYTSNSFESTLPWSSLERNLVLARILVKIIYASFFVFDKQGKIKGVVNIVCVFLLSIIIYKRMTSALIFKAKVYYAMIFYEVELLWIAL